MAATFAYRPAGSGFHAEKIPGSFFDALIEVTSGTNDYAAGGYAFGVTQLNTLSGGAYSTIESVEIADHWRTAAGGGTTMYIAVWDSINGKVQAYSMGGAVTAGTPFSEVPNSNPSFSGFRCTLRVRFN